VVRPRSPRGNPTCEVEEVFREEGGWEEVRRALILLILVLAALVTAMSAPAAPFTVVYPQANVVNTTLSTANHVLLFAYPFSLSQYRLFYNDSGNLYPLTQMVLDGAIVVQGYNPAWYGSIVLLNASSYVPNSSVTPAYSFTAGSKRLLNSGGTLYTRSDYVCLSAPSATSYLYAPRLSVSSTAYFYAHIVNGTLPSGSRLGFSYTFGDVAYSSNPGVQAAFNTVYVYVADASMSTIASMSTGLPTSKVVFVMARRSTYLTVWNATSTWYSGATGSTGLAATAYYPSVKVVAGGAVCVGLLALSTSPVPLFSASYTARVVSIPLLVYSSQPFNVTAPKQYTLINVFLSSNVPRGSRMLTLTVPAGTTVLYDSAMNLLFAFSFKTQTTIVLDGTNVTYAKVNGNVYYLYPSSGKITISPPSSPTTVTFTVQDYGAGYQALQDYGAGYQALLAYDLSDNLVASAPITALGQAALNLTPYASYLLQVCKPGVCKAVGLVTISSANIQLTVMPSIPAVNPPSWVSAAYDYTGKQLIVNVSCTSPPCSVTIRKVLVNGTQVGFAQLTCNAQLCGYALSAQDPYFLVTVQDASGKTAQASTGLSVPLWQSPLGSIVNTIGRVTNLDAFGVNVNDFVIVLVGLAVMYLGFTFRNWELAVLAFGAWLTLGTLLLGGSGRLVLPGLSLALVGAALSYMLRRELQP
jgi:hypothetical protein